MWSRGGDFVISGGGGDAVGLGVRYLGAAASGREDVPPHQQGEHAAQGVGSRQILVLSGVDEEACVESGG